MRIEQSTAWKEQFLERLAEDQWDSWTFYKMSIDIANYTLIPSFTGLQSLNYLPNVTPLPHQIEAAERVISEMNGRAILADEVGLGKTIQAGLVLKEYMIRGLVKKALILVPASLANQWAEELYTKFHIAPLLYKKNYGLDGADIVVMSIDTAKRSPHKEKIFAEQYDLLIVDEAHKLKNHKTISYQFVESLKKKFCLLLTATPIQNDVFELFYLVTLLKQGHLGNYETFSKAFSASERTEEQDQFIKQLVGQVMIRNRRQGIEWTKRRIEAVRVDFTAEERQLYERLSNVKDSPAMNAFSVLTLQREMCSSGEAVVQTLQKLLEGSLDNETAEELKEIAQKLQRQAVHSKAQKTLELVRKAAAKVIIFTEYKATQLYLSDYLFDNGISNVVYNGKLSKSSRDWVKYLFKERADVLIATESAAEGINLQFCHQVINYDLPWNPMKLEQRIGRVHRFGQKRDVHIYNLAVNETIDDRILDVLQGKIDTFEQVVGELDAILTS